MSNSLLAAALSAVTSNTIITYDDYVTKKLGYEIQYDELDQKSLHQSHLVGGKVPSVTLPEPIKVPRSLATLPKLIKVPSSLERSLKPGQIYVKSLAGKTITLEFKPS